LGLIRAGRESTAGAGAATAPNGSSPAIAPPANPTSAARRDTPELPGDAITVHPRWPGPRG
jgi:hypothetical protein